MSEWLDKDAEEFSKTLDDKQYRENNMNLSNYWFELKRQIESDVKDINNRPEWHYLLKDSPVRIEEIEDSYASGYAIEIKLQGASAMVGFFTEAGKIKLKIGTHRQGKRDEEKKRNVEVVEDGQNIVLKCLGKKYIVPNQASKYILEPITDTLKFVAKL